MLSAYQWFDSFLKFFLDHNTYRPIKNRQAIEAGSSCTENWSILRVRCGCTSFAHGNVCSHCSLACLYMVCLDSLLSKIVLFICSFFIFNHLLCNRLTDQLHILGMPLVMPKDLDHMLTLVGCQAWQPPLINLIIFLITAPIQAGRPLR